MLESKIVKIRWIKSYPEAYNHIAIGKVIEENDVALKVDCKTYHFGKVISGKNCDLKVGTYVGGMLEGKPAVRVIPWNRVELIHELPDETEWYMEGEFDENGNCVLKDKNKTLISGQRDDSD